MSEPAWQQPNPERPQEPQVAQEPHVPEDPPWQLALYGLGAWGLTGAFYAYISAFEAGDADSVRIWWPVALVYNLAGKWPIVGLGALLGVVLLVAAAAGWRKQQASVAG